MELKKYLKKIFRNINKNYQNEYLLKRELKYFKNCKNILDIGCGDGEFVSYDNRIIGIDGNKKSVSLAKKKKLNVKYGLATSLPFKNNSFEGVHCAHVIEHLFPEDAHKMLKEISRVLKKDGILVISTPIMWSGFYNDFTHLKPYNPEALIRYLVNEGQNKTLPDINTKYDKIDFYWRYRTLPLNGKFTYLIANYLFKYGFHTLSRDAYTMILRKK